MVFYKDVAPSGAKAQRMAVVQSMGANTLRLGPDILNFRFWPSPHCNIHHPLGHDDDFLDGFAADELLTIPVLMHHLSDQVNGTMCVRKRQPCAVLRTTRPAPPVRHRPAVSGRAPCGHHGGSATR